jgi:general stress protein 26
MMFDNDRTDAERLTAKFWENLDDSPFMMVGLQGVEDSRTRPMTAQIDRQDRDKKDGGPIYFFASKTDGVGQDIGQGKRAVATFAAKDHGLFAHVHGRLVPSDDRAVIERLWNPIIASWYKDGKDDPDLQLLRLDTDRADIWEASAGSTLKAAALKALFDIDPGKEHQSEHQATVTL